MKKLGSEYKVDVVKLNNYTKPSTQFLITQSSKWSTFGTDNSYFYDLIDNYMGSTTNRSVIDGVCGYIYGKGLKVKNNAVDLKKIISKEDVRLIVKDIKLTGNFAFQIIYSKDRRSIVKIYHIPIEMVAPTKMEDVTDAPNSYWYCYNWKNKSKFKPQQIPAYGYGLEDLAPMEVYYGRIPSKTLLFSECDYEPVTQYCLLEERMSNYYINHIDKNFSAGKIININQGIPEGPEVREEAESDIKKKVTGTDAAGTTIISFNDNKDHATTVDTIEVTNAYEQFQWMSEEASRKIIMGHKINDPALFGLPTPTGFSNVADQTEQALKILYRNQINPFREILTDAFDEVFAYNGEGWEFEFEDFEDFTQAPVPPQPTQFSSVTGYKIGLEYDSDIENELRSMVKDFKLRGKDLYIVSSRCDVELIKEFARENGIEQDKVYATCSNINKVEKIKELGLDEFYDNNNWVVKQLPSIGKLY